MLKINVIRKVEIEPISEEWLHEVVREKLQESLPAGVEITRVDFVRKLNPQRIEVEVDAQFTDKEPLVKEEPVKLEMQLEELQEEVTKEEVADSMKSIFG